MNQWRNEGVNNAALAETDRYFGSNREDWY